MLSIGFRDFWFYWPSYTTRIIELDQALFLENDFGIKVVDGPREIEFKEECTMIPILVMWSYVFYSSIDQELEITQDEYVI